MINKHSAPPTLPFDTTLEPVLATRHSSLATACQSPHFANRNRRNSLKTKASALIQSLHFHGVPCLRAPLLPCLLVSSPHFLPPAENLITKPRLEIDAND